MEHEKEKRRDDMESGSDSAEESMEVIEDDNRRKQARPRDEFDDDPRKCKRQRLTVQWSSQGHAKSKQTILDELFLEFDTALKSLLPTSTRGIPDTKWTEITGSQIYRIFFGVKRCTTEHEDARLAVYLRICGWLSSHTKRQYEALSRLAAIPGTPAGMILKQYSALWTDYVIVAKDLHDTANMHHLWLPPDSLARLNELYHRLSSFDNARSAESKECEDNSVNSTIRVAPTPATNTCVTGASARGDTHTSASACEPSSDHIVPDVFSIALDVWRNCLFNKIRPLLVSDMIAVLQRLWGAPKHAIGAVDALPYGEIVELIQSLMRNFLVLCHGDRQSPLEPFWDELMPAYVDAARRFFRETTASFLRDDAVRENDSNAALFAYYGRGLSEMLRFCEDKFHEEILRLQSFRSRSPGAISASQSPASHPAKYFSNEIVHFRDVYTALLTTCWSISDSLVCLDERLDYALAIHIDDMCDVFRTVFVVEHIDTLLRAVPELIRNREGETLQRIVRLFDKVGGIEASTELRNVIAQYFRTECNALLDRLDPLAADCPRMGKADFTKRVSDYTEALLSFIVMHRNTAGAQFTTELDRAVAASVNRNTHACRFIALAIDLRIREAYRGWLVGNFEDEISQLLDLVKYIDDKDLFTECYIRDLGVRLVDRWTSSSKVDTALEATAISQLKSRWFFVGFGSLVSRLERMIGDVATSAELASEFKLFYAPAVGSVNQVQKETVELVPLVVSAGYWPVASILSSSQSRAAAGMSAHVKNGVVSEYLSSTSIGTFECVLPAAVEAAWTTFREFYRSKYISRTLSFLGHLGSAELRAMLGDRSYSLTVPTHAMVVLNFFNNWPSLTFRELREITGIPQQFLVQTLVVLSSARPAKGANKPILEHQRVAASGSVEDREQIGEGDIFTVASDFYCPRRTLVVRFKNIKWQSSTPSASVKEAKHDLEEERKLQLDAMIVRIMKAHKVMQHNQLVSEVVKQMTGRFLPQPHAVKCRIQALIEREYLIRDSEKIDIYHYAA